MHIVDKWNSSKNQMSNRSIPTQEVTFTDTRAGDTRMHRHVKNCGSILGVFGTRRAAATFFLYTSLPWKQAM